MQAQRLFDDGNEVGDRAGLGVGNDGFGVTVGRDAGVGHFGAHAGEDDGGGGDEEKGGAESGGSSVGAGDELEESTALGFAGRHAVLDEGMHHICAVHFVSAVAVRRLAAGETVYS